MRPQTCGVFFWCYLSETLYLQPKDCVLPLNLKYLKYTCFDISLSFFFLYFVFFAISWTPAAVKIMSFYENLVCKRNTRKLLRATEVGIF